MSDGKIGHNSNVDGDDLPGDLTEAQFYSAMRMQAKFDEERAALNKRIGAFRKDLKARGVTLQVFDAVRALADQEEETVAAHLKERFKYMRWAKISVGDQSDLFPQELEEKDISDPFNDGFKAGTMGLERSPPDYLAPNDAQKWLEGYNDGQKHLAFTEFEDKYKAGVDLDDTSSAAENVKKSKFENGDDEKKEAGKGTVSQDGKEKKIPPKKTARPTTPKPKATAE